MSHENMYFAESELCNGTLNDKLVDSQRKKREPRAWRKNAASSEVAMVVRRGVVARVEVKREHDALDPFVADGGELLAALSPEERRNLLQGDPPPDRWPPAPEAALPPPADEPPADEPPADGRHTFRRPAVEPSGSASRRKGAKRPRAADAAAGSSSAARRRDRDAALLSFSHDDG